MPGRDEQDGRSRCARQRGSRGGRRPSASGAARAALDHEPQAGPCGSPERFPPPPAIRSPISSTLATRGSTSPTTAPSYITTIRSASVHDLVEVLADQEDGLRRGPQPRGGSRAPSRSRRRRTRAWVRPRQGHAGRPRTPGRARPSGDSRPTTAGRCVGPRCLHVVAIDHLDGAVADSPEPENRPRRVGCRYDLSADVRGDAEALGQPPVCMRSSGTRAIPAVIAARGSPAARSVPPTLTMPALIRSHARHGLGELALSVSGDAGDAEHLAAPHDEGKRS